MLLLALSDCGETPEDGERFSFIAADNQAGDPSLEWATDVVHRGLSAAVGYSTADDTIAEARLAAGAPNRIVYSTLSNAPDGEARLHSAIYRAADHQFVREFTVTGNVLQVINRMATSINPEAGSIGTKSIDVLRAWPVFHGNDMPEFEAACLAMADAEPDFSGALSSCAERLIGYKRSETLRQLLDKLQLEKVRQFPVDAQDLFAKGYMDLKDYPKAAKLYRMAASSRPLLKNLVGYAEALAGNYDAGKQAIEEYGRLPKQEQNSLDSLGEISFFCGKYREAEQYFLASQMKLLGGAPQEAIEPLKVAAARLMTGDVAGANQLANAQIEKIAKGNPQGAANLKPVWLTIAGAPTPQDRKELIERVLIRRP